MPNPPRAIDATAAFLHGALDLVAAIRRTDPAVAAVLDAAAGVRVSVDLAERVALVSVVDRHGRSHALSAVVADPHDPARFGEIAPPEPVRGLHDDVVPAELAH